jgi:hypothetical protein
LKGKICRRGFRTGELIEIGGINISPTDQAGSDYKALLEASIAVHKADVLKHAGTPYEYVANGCAQAEEAILLCEINRIETGEWIRPIQKSTQVATAT